MKFLIHTIDGVGLGHVVRTVEIAKAIKKMNKFIEIVFLTNSRFPEYIEKSGFRYIQLEGYTKNTMSDEDYREYLNKNLVEISKIVEEENPDLLIMDSELNIDLLRYCKNKIKTCYVLREKPEKDLFKIKPALKYFDLVLVPHHKFELPKCYQDLDVSFSGPIIKIDGEIIDYDIVISMGAGSSLEENIPFYKNINDFLEKVRNNNYEIDGYKIKILTGPFYDNQCNLDGFEKIDFEFRNIKPKLLISQAGYNTINELIYNKIPAILIPVKRRQDDQLKRAESLEKSGCVEVLRGDLFEQVKNVLGRLGIMTQKFPEIQLGNNKAAQVIMDLFDCRKTVTILRGEYLPVSERFIHDEINSFNFYKSYIVTLKKTKDFDNGFYDSKYDVLYSEKYPMIDKVNHQLYKDFLRDLIPKLSNSGLLYAEFITDALFFLKLKKVTKLPFVVAVRGYDLYTNTYDLINLFSQVNFFLVKSEYMKQHLISLGCSIKKICVQHSGIIVSKKDLSKDYSKIKILLAGRLVEKKNTLFGIEVFKKLKKSNLELHIVGDGPLKDEVMQTVSGFDNIVYHGKMSNGDLMNLMKESHILFHPSITAKNGDKEGLPNVAMEAMARGLIVVASNHAGIEELNKDFLFEENDVGGAISQLNYVIQNIKNLEDIKNKNYNYINMEFNAIKLSARLEKTFSEMIEPKPSYEKYYENLLSVKKGKFSNFRIDIHPIQGCNSHCVTCDNWKLGIKQILTNEQIIKFMYEAKNQGATSVRFHGQEPTLCKFLPELILVAKELGYEIGLKTNASNLEMLKDIQGLDILYLSIDSPYEQIHDSMRIKGSFEKNLQAVSTCSNVLINSVVTNKNYLSLLNMPEFAFGIGAKKISFVLPNNKNRKEIEQLLLSEDQLKQFYFEILPEVIHKCVRYGIDYDINPLFVDLVNTTPQKAYYFLKYNSIMFLDEIKRYYDLDYGSIFYKKYGCQGSLDHLTMNYDGNVYPCCVVERNKDNSVGNIVNDKFDDIWNLEEYDKIRKCKQCPHMAGCGSNFPVRKWLFEKQKEANLDDKSNAEDRLEIIYKFNRLSRKDMDVIFLEKLENIKKISKSVSYQNSNEILEKEDVRNNFYDLISKHAVDFVTDRTSGSFDETVPFAHEKNNERFVRMIYPFTLHTDWKIGDKYYVFTTLHCSRDRCSNNDLPFYVNRIKIPTSQNIFTDDVALDKAAIMLEPNTIVHADPYYLLSLALYMNKNNMKIKLKAISSTYELLTPSIKKLLSETFDCKVFNSYGCSEVGPIAYGCEYGNMHIFEDSVKVDIINKNKNGVGEIILTSLNNEVMPLVNYRVGDIGKFVDKKCQCGSNSKILEIHGRKKNFENNEKSEKELADMLNIDNLIAFQIEGQEIRVIGNPDSDKIREMFPYYNVKNVDSFDSEESGKFRLIK